MAVLLRLLSSIPWAALGAAGRAILAPLLASLLAGKTLRSLLFRPISWITGKTRTREDDKIAETIREDWELPAPEPIETEAGHVEK